MAILRTNRLPTNKGPPYLRNVSLADTMSSPPIGLSIALNVSLLRTIKPSYWWSNSKHFRSPKPSVGRLRGRSEGVQEEPRDRTRECRQREKLAKGDEQARSRARRRRNLDEGCRRRLARHAGPFRHGVDDGRRRRWCRWCRGRAGLDDGRHVWRRGGFFYETSHLVDGGRAVLLKRPG